MKRYIYFALKLFFSLALFATFVAFTEKPIKEKTQYPEVFARDSRHGRGHSRHGHSDHRGGSGIYFRFDVGPGRDRYYRDYYPEYVRVNCEIFDTKNERVDEIQVGGRTIYLGGAGDGRRYYFSLRPGYHTIRWRVTTEDYFGARHRNYSRNFKVYRDRGEINITIKGSNISIG